jgi:hypothetical protein
MRATAPIDQSVGAAFAVPTPPDIGAISRDPHRDGSVSNGPPVFNPPAQPKPALRGQWSITVHREASWVVWLCASSTLAQGASSMGGPCQQGPWSLQLADPIVGIGFPAFVLLHEQGLHFTHSLLDELAALRNHRYLNLDFPECLPHGFG